MLEIQRIRREKESIIEQLKVVRKVDLSETINKLFILDEEKRDAQKGDRGNIVLGPDLSGTEFARPRAGFGIGIGAW